MEILHEKRAGNLILRIEKDEEIETLVVKSVAGHVEVRLRNDTSIFAIIKKAMEDEQEDLYGIVAHLWFLQVTAVPDGEYIDDALQAYDALSYRFQNGYKPENEETEDEIIEDMERSAQLEEAAEE